MIDPSAFGVAAKQNDFENAELGFTAIFMRISYYIDDAGKLGSGCLFQ
ncbi:hypothetical protein P4S72_13285 [Vibrio sp. PP-XX7]